MIWIRADGGKTLGMGHIMRCCSVAQQLVLWGQRVLFLTADEGPAEVLASRGLEIHVLDTDYRDMESELPLLRKLAEEECPQAILADSYQVTETYMNGLREIAPVAYTDDMCALSFSVDVLINYNIYGEEAIYVPNVIASAKKTLMGPRFAPLRKEFAGVKNPLRKQASKLLITTGGSDPYNLAGKFVRELRSREAFLDWELVVVSGAFNVNLPDLQGLSAQDKNMRLVINASDMQVLMEECDLAISAGGSTCYELASVGIPFVTFSFVDNQERIVQGLAEKGFVPFGGDYLREGDEMIIRAVNSLEKMCSYEDRLEYSCKLQTMTDGLGAGRIAEALINL